MPIPSVNGVYYLPSVLVTGVAVQGNSSASTSSLISSDLPANMILDWGVMYSYLPASVVEGIYSDLGVTYNPDTQIGLINCTMGQKNYNISFTFTDFDISVPVSDLIVGGNGETCTLGLGPSKSEGAVLGNTFLRSAYIVYDLSNNEISMAQRDFDSVAEDNILEIGNGTNPVPGVVSVSVTASAPVPTTVVIPDGFELFPSATTTTASASATTTKGAAALPPSSPTYLLTGLVGGGLLFTL